MKNPEKFTAQLTKRLDKAADSEYLDIIVELNPQTEEKNIAQPAASRQERIAALQKNFALQSAPVESAIEEVGGEVVGRAWINQTLKARVPVGGIEQISEYDEVTAVDVPQSLEENSE